MLKPLLLCALILACVSVNKAAKNELSDDLKRQGYIAVDSYPNDGSDRSIDDEDENNGSRSFKRLKWASSDDSTSFERISETTWAQNQDGQQVDEFEEVKSAIDDSGKDVVLLRRDDGLLFKLFEGIAKAGFDEEQLEDFYVGDWVKLDNGGIPVGTRWLFENNDLAYFVKTSDTEWSEIYDSIEVNVFTEESFVDDNGFHEVKLFRADGNFYYLLTEEQVRWGFDADNINFPISFGRYERIETTTTTTTTTTRRPTTTTTRRPTTTTTTRRPTTTTTTQRPTTTTTRRATTTTRRSRELNPLQYTRWVFGDGSSGRSFVKVDDKLWKLKSGDGKRPEKLVEMSANADGSEVVLRFRDDVYVKLTQDTLYWSESPDKIDRVANSGHWVAE